MKKVIFLAFILAAAFAVNAQSKPGKDVQFSGGLRLALPTGNFHYSSSFGVGAELQAEYKLSSQASLTGTTGFTNFIGKTDKFYGYKYSSVGYIPILVGARVYPADNVFVGGKVGYGILTGGGSGGAFNFEPQVGYNGDKYQLALGYNALVDNGTLGHLGVTAVYKFN
jgi:hypothetical protein